MFTGEECTGEEFTGEEFTGEECTGEEFSEEELGAFSAISARCGKNIRFVSQSVTRVGREKFNPQALR